MRNPFKLKDTYAVAVVKVSEMDAPAAGSVKLRCSKCNDLVWVAPESLRILHELDFSRRVKLLCISTCVKPRHLFEQMKVTLDRREFVKHVEKGTKKR